MTTNIIAKSRALGIIVGRPWIIRNMRELANLTQRDIATSLGVTDGAVAHWENGRSLPQGDHPVKLIELLTSACRASGIHDIDEQLAVLGPDSYRVAIAMQNGQIEQSEGEIDRQDSYRQALKRRDVK